MKRKATARTHKSTERVTYTPDALARVLGVARNTVYAALRNGRIPHIRIGRRFVIPKAAVDAWFASIGEQTSRVGGLAR
jgi:excisionase family DNA binding protein